MAVGRNQILSVVSWVLAIVAIGVMLLVLAVPASVTVETQGSSAVGCTPVLGTDPDYRLGVRDTGGNGMQAAIGGCAAAHDRALGIALVLAVAATGLGAAGQGFRRHRP